MKKWKNLVDTFRRKYNQSGSGGTPIGDSSAVEIL